jgi:hypothetical protein
MAMSNTTQLNLDRLAAKHAQVIIERTAGKKASNVDNTVTKALGVLQENGVYACFLYLLAKEKENGTVVVEEMLKLLEGLNLGWQAPKSNGEIDTKPEAVLPFISDKVMQNLERLLLAKETLEQMLIYARYGAKARG